MIIIMTRYEKIFIFLYSYGIVYNNYSNTFFIISNIVFLDFIEVIQIIQNER